MTDAPGAHPRYLTAAEAAEVLRCSRKTVYNLVHRGELAVIRRPGAPWLVPAAAIEEYEERYLCPAAPQSASSPDSPSPTGDASGTSSGRSPAEADHAAARQASRLRRTASAIRGERR